MTRGLVASQLSERRAFIDLQTETSFSATHYATLVRFSRLALQSAVLGLGAYLTVIGQLSAGGVIAASLLLTRALAPIEQLVGSWRGIVQARLAYINLQRLFGPDQDRIAPMQLPPLKGQISIERVTCLAGEHRQPLLNAIDLAVEPGSFVGVIGPSGAGKSTLLRAIVGAVPTAAGAVRLDGASLNEWDHDQLARQIGYLPQDFMLFPGTVRDNISRFESHIAENTAEVDARTVEAAMAAGIHETVLELPDGYHTRVGMGGAGLSAGQTQRIALARAFYGNPRLYVLDEPNAHLDLAGEQQLLEQLEVLKRAGATIVVAAHRGAILSAADRLLLLRDGRVDLYGGLTDVAATMRARAEAAMAPTRTAQAASVSA
jgi:ATP-binding cassette subfamily C protein